MEIDKEAFEILSRQIRAEEEQNRLKQAEITVLRRQEANYRGVLDRYAGDSEETRALRAELRELIQMGYALIERIEQIADNIQRIEQRSLLMLGSLVSGDSAARIVDQTEKEHIRQLIKQKDRRLKKLKEQQAQTGIGTSPHILTEIEDLEAEIADLKKALRKR